MRIKYIICNNYIKCILIVNLAFVVCVINSSCYVSKNADFLHDLSQDSLIEKYSQNNVICIIKPNDVLFIKVSSASADLDAIFNAASNEKINEAGTDKNGNGFLVNENGEINIHFLGKIKVEGLSKNQLKNKLENELKPFMKDPIVNVGFLNKKVTVLGQVVNPRILNISDNQTSIFDVIASCGNLKDGANTSDLIIVRDSAYKKMVKHINIENHSFVNSPWYYVKSDDIIYVKKDNKKLDKDIRKRELQTAVSLTASVFSLVVLVLNLIKK